MAKVAFKVSGEFITDHARNLVIEHSCDNAIRFLIDSIQEFTYDNCLEIISGKSKLVGINEFQLVDEDENDENLKEYLDNINYLYSNVVYDGGIYFKPYGFVSRYCYEDVNSRFLQMNKYVKYFNSSIPNNLPGSNNVSFSLARATFYMKNPKEDKAVICKINGTEYVVLFEEIKNYPLFLTPIKGPGAYQRSIKDLDLFDMSSQVDLDPNYDLNFGCKEEEKEKEKEKEKEEEEEEETDPLVISFQKLIEKGMNQAHNIDAVCGWLDPKGNIIPCEYYQHSTLAYVISEKLKLNSSNLEQYGYVKLQNHSFFLSFVDFEVTQAQYDTIFDYCDCHKIEMPLNITIK